MRSFAIRARFPLGYFVGHQGAGQVAEFPDTARLYGALIHAAAEGSTAEMVDDELKPTHSSLTALKWLEEHPPSSLALPRTTRMNSRPAHTYRAEGVFESKTKPYDRKVLKSQSDGIAVDGAFGWIWEQDVPAGVADTISKLCVDVSCLGEADSPVVLDTERVPATHVHDPHASAFARGAKLAVASPVAGRLAELERDYVSSRPARRPTVSNDKFAWGSYPSSHTPSRERVRDMVYRPLAQPVLRAPWARLITVPFVGRFQAEDRVPLCVAVHRTLVANLGDNAPAFITGRYLDGAGRPANRLAIHVLEAGHPGVVQDSIGFLIPPGVSDIDLAALARSVQALQRVWVPRSATSIELKHSAAAGLDAAVFWREPAAGTSRFWTPAGALVPEVRRQKAGNWTLADAAVLSAAFTCRESLGPVRSTRSDRYGGLVRAAVDRGVRVHHARLINDSRAHLFAHKMPEGVPVTPYNAWVEMGDLVPSQALFALGQSRHLGGGLMLPVDLDEATARAMGLSS